MARRLILVLIALMVSAGTIFLAQQWLRGNGSKTAGASPAAAAAPPVQVLVAKADLYAGQFIRPEELTWQSWPAGPTPDSYFVQTKARIGDLVGAVVRSRIAAGQPVTSSQVVRPGDRGFLAVVLTPGTRAVTVNVTPSTGVAGFAFPGDRVDLLLTMTLHPVGPNSGGPDRHVSETILHDVRLVGMDQSFTDGRKDEKADLSVPKTATLDVSPKQAEKVAVAQDLGVMTLALRSLATPGDSGADGKVSKTWDVEVTQIAQMGYRGPGGSTPAAAPPPPPPWTVDVVHGGGVSQTSIASPSIAPNPGVVKGLKP
jgi:pilus assembly protein CpaB